MDRSEKTTEATEPFVAPNLNLVVNFAKSFKPLPLPSAIAPPVVVEKLNLLPHQTDHFTRMLTILKDNFAFLDTSQTGCGKTFTTMKLAQISNYKLLVVCPKSVCSVWNLECKKYGVPLIEAFTYEKLRGVKKQTSPNRYVDRAGNSFRASDIFTQLVGERILLVFDEVHRAKNRATATLAAAHSLVREIVRVNNGSRVACLSASPFDKSEHALSIMKVLGIIMSKGLYEYDRSEREYNLTGMQEVMNYAKRVNPTEAAKISVFPHNAKGINKACYNHFVNIVKPVVSTSMPRPAMRSTFDAKNGYYNMSREDALQVFNGSNALAAATRYNAVTHTIEDSRPPNFGAITLALMQIEAGKVNTLFRLSVQTLTNDPNSKVIIYAWYKSSMKALLDKFTEIGFPARIMNGDTKQVDRTEIISSFQAPTTKLRVIITSCPVGGVGLTLDDQHGDYPRTSYAVPNYWFIDLFQAGGRTFRVLTKSKATLRFVYGKNATIESQIYDALVRKSNTTKSTLFDSSKVVFPGDLEKEIEEDPSQIYSIYDMNKFFDSKLLGNFCKYLYNMEWLYEVPGGFITNFPKRMVNTYGNGASISNCGKIGSDKWNRTHWTAKINNSSIVLHTKPLEIPQVFADMVPGMRKLFAKTYPSARINDFTFSIAVCNNYTSPDMYIAAHTDDNDWYPRECDEGTVFASVTLYPNGVPDKYARFQIRTTNGWQQVDLPHQSVLIMPSNIEHRVLPYLKRDKHLFKPRINVTFRSTYPRKVDPLRNLMAISNHARYYRVPYAISCPSDCSNEDEIIEKYKNFCTKCDYPKLNILRLEESKTTRTKRRKNLIDQYHAKNFPRASLKNNLTLETIQDVMNIINQK